MSSGKSCGGAKRRNRMKKNRATKTIVCLAALWIASPVFPDAAKTVLLAPESSLWLVGDSTLHPFTCRTTDMVLSVDIDAARAAEMPTVWDAFLDKGALSQMQLVIPVKSLKSKDAAL